MGVHIFEKGGSYFWKNGVHKKGGSCAADISRNALSRGGSCEPPEPPD